MTDYQDITSMFSDPFTFSMCLACNTVLYYQLSPSSTKQFALLKWLNLIKSNKPTKYVVTERHCAMAYRDWHFFSL